MNTKQIRHSFKAVFDAANSVECEDMHHKPAHQHAADEVCPAKYELDKHISQARVWLADMGVNPR
jgi:hypothetical protein